MTPTASEELPSDQKDGDGDGSDSDSSCCGTSRLRRSTRSQVSHRCCLPAGNDVSLFEPITNIMHMSMSRSLHAGMANLLHTSVGEWRGAHRAGFKGAA